MKTLIYNSAGLAVNDRLAISSLLNLFQSRLNARWISSTHASTKTADDAAQILFIDVDQPEGRQTWVAARPHSRIAVTGDNPTQYQPFVSRPIRAYGPNGVIVLLNHIAQAPALPEGPKDSPREPARIRMLGRLETTAPARPFQPPSISKAPTIPAPPIPEAPARERVAIRWSAPEPVLLSPLRQMPNARIHRFGNQPERPAVEISFEPPAPPAVKFYTAPETNPLPELIDMPVAHRPSEPNGWVPRIVSLPKAGLPMDVRTEETPTLRSSPPEWRAPEPEPETKLFDFASLAETPAPVEITPETKPQLSDDEEVTALFAEVERNLQNLEQALTQEPETEVEWWDTPSSEADTAIEHHAGEGSLFEILKSAKASAQPGILEIAGLPAVCVIPTRNVYFTTAPAARIEAAISVHSAVSWRGCASEEEARKLSGTGQSRQASLEQLSWIAGLLAPIGDADALAEQAVRLRRWPPITESRGRSKFLRYATMLSGAHATPRELSEITGEPLPEILSFVSACLKMNLLDTTGESRAPLVAPQASTMGAGVLRGMIEKLTPPSL